MAAQTQNEKWAKLEYILGKFESLAVAFSGGVDSTFLLASARQIIGENVIAVTAESPVHPQREKTAAAEIAKSLNTKHITLASGELDIEKKEFGHHQHGNFYSGVRQKIAYCQ